MTIGYETYGAGPRRVVIMNDWLCDTSTWDGARAYLDTARFTYAFADLRGYGRSRGRAGEHTLQEAASDVLGLAGELGWPVFAIAGHSMSSLVALHLAQQAPERIERAVVVTPPPPGGFGVDEATLTGLRALALGDDDRRRKGLEVVLGDRLSDGWIRFKAERWRATSDAEAVAAYAELFARRGLPDPAATIACPLLAITGEQDGEIMRSAAVARLLTPLSAALVVAAIAESGHYPMQENPPLFVSILERFLAGDEPRPSPRAAER